MIAVVIAYIKAGHHIDHANGESMALIKCSECGTEISDSAGACLKCGAPMDVARRGAAVSVTAPPGAVNNPKKKGAGLALGICILALGVVVLVIEMSGSHETTAAQTSPQAALAASGMSGSDFSEKAPGPTIAAASEAAAKAAADAAEASEVAAEMALMHNYTTEQEGEYGYQAAIGNDDRNSGIAAKPLMMIRYRGVIAGRTTIDEQSSEGGVMRLDCKDPCDFIRLRLMVDGQTVHTETLPNHPSTLGGEMMDDARNGKLKVYAAK
jgi:hypothetical protein